jgi:thiamine phosphate synthase YjbQ (UPF0047 family)
MARGREQAIKAGRPSTSQRAIGMRTHPSELIIEVQPSQRVDIIDVRGLLSDPHSEALDAFPRALYCSYHTTAGFLEQGLAARLDGTRHGVTRYLSVFQTMFPEGAGYEHDKMHLRAELSEEQRRVEPRNADSHLAFIGAGLRNCVTYVNRPQEPVYFVDLDGVNEGRPRRRLASVLGFHREEVVTQTCLTVPVSAHPVDSVNLKDPRLGIYEQLQELVGRYDVTKGRIHVTLSSGERHAGLTVNEYETLLMRHDLMEVLRDPLRYVAEKGRNMLASPRAIPNRTIEYAKYDMVRVFNELFDTFGMNETLVEKILARLIAVPASRFLRMKRSVSLLVTDRECTGRGAVVQGCYQSPILVQWHKAARQQRTVDITLTRFV